MNDFSRVLQVLKGRKTERFAMATVIGNEGSAYRHEGAKMLIDERGKTYGLISGGCLEENLIYHAKEVLQSGQSQIVKYDLKSENDLEWGQGAGCNGVIYIYIEEIGWNILKDRHGHSIWEGIDQKLLSGCCVASVKFIDEDHKIKSSIYYCEDGEVLCGSNCLDKSLFTYLETFVSCEKKVDFVTKEGEGRMLAELYKPKEVLYIFGAGPDTEPLVEVVSKLDFSVRVIDPRSERFDHGNFSTADQLIIEFPHVYLQHNHLHLNSFVLIMTHNFRWDQSILKHFVKKSPQYLGILGPKKRTERLLYPEPIPEWIHSPVGLDIFAEGPEEIAISISAELIKRRNSKKKNHTKLGDGFSKHEKIKQIAKK